MAKSKAKQKAAPQTKWASLPWKAVQVGKEVPTDVENADVNSKQWMSNHYDNPKARISDLYQGDSTNDDDFMEGANDPGMFMGLEVIDGSQYAVEKVPLSGGSAESETVGFVSRLVIKDANDLFLENEESKKEPPSKRKRKEELPPQASKSKPKQAPPPEAEVDGGEGKTLSRKERNKLKLEKMKARRKEIKLKKKRKREDAEEAKKEGADIPSEATGKIAKKKKAGKKISNSDAVNEAITEKEMASVQVPWSIATGGVYLHPIICKALHRLNFFSPTPIQSSTLAASILGLRDIVGAAPTGSGKTLSYLLPILQHILTEQDTKNEEAGINQSASTSPYPLIALILCPTRELAMQVSMEFSKLVSNVAIDGASQSYKLIQCGTIVGGLSEQKQKRVLDVKRPPVLVGTPGRLWDLMATGDHKHLTDLKKLRFLVVDEADRMISQGSFPQLKGIFEKIQQANPSLEYMRAHEDVEYESDSDDEDRMLGLPGLPGEAKVTMLDDNILKMIERQRKGLDMETDQDPDDELESGDNGVLVPQPVEINDAEYDAENARLQELTEGVEERDEEDKPVKRQTFIFSATLTLPASDESSALRSKGKKGKKGKAGKLSVDGAIAEILEKVGAQGQTKVVDLSVSSSTQLTKQINAKISDSQSVPSQRSNIKLPPGLSLYEILCTQKHKDSHLYSFLATTKQGSSGPCLVFCNSIGAVKRVGETLKVLGLPVKMLHAQMQQKARLGSLESLSRQNTRAIVVATDVAARGLDIPSVASVVHYDVARAVDTFVHRAGRTARGMGENAIGWSVSLVAAPEEKKHKTICRAVQGNVSNSFDTAPMDSRLLSIAQARTNLASKIVACEDAESKTNKKNQWFRDASKDAGLDLDEDLLEEGQMGGSKKDRQQYIEAKRARQDLKVLLAKPMRKQAFGKFLSNAGLMDSIKSENEVKPHVVRKIKKVQKKKKKQSMTAS